MNIGTPVNLFDTEKRLQLHTSLVCFCKFLAEKIFGDQTTCAGVDGSYYGRSGRGVCCATLVQVVVL